MPPHVRSGRRHEGAAAGRVGRCVGFDGALCGDGADAAGRVGALSVRHVGGERPGLRDCRRAAGLSERHGWPGADARLFVFAGLLGGFTTFSAFGLDAMALMRRGETGMAFAYVAGSVVVGLVGAWVGMRLALR